MTGTGIRHATRNGQQAGHEHKELNVPAPGGNGLLGVRDSISSVSTISTEQNMSYSTEDITLVEYPPSARPTDFKHVIMTILISLLAWPTTYGLNLAFVKIEENERALWMAILGFALMAFIVLLVLMSTKVHDWLYYGSSLFAFTAVIDLIISLEHYDIIHGYMDQYLKLGETYLKSSWGNAITLYDAIGFYLLYLTMNFQLANRISWRSTAIYWASGLMNSMIVFVIGIFCGSHSATTCTLLNIPYVLFPVMVLIRAFQRQKPTSWVEDVKHTFSSTIYSFGSAVALLASIWFTLSKGLAVLGCNKGFVPLSVHSDKALTLNEPGPFAATQALVFFFYLLPLQLVSLYYHFKTTKPRLVWDLTLIQAGAVMQGQFAYLVYSFDPKLPEDIQVAISNTFFWFANLIVLISPHFLLLGLLRHKWGRPPFAMERVLRKSK